MGQIEVLGEPLTERSKDKIGYLPEERGLYKKLTLMQSLQYIAALKGVDSQQADKKAGELLQRVGMTAHRHKKIEELSRGMGQLVQFLVTIIHEPDLIILDEPFANLDPVNTELLKDIIFELRAQDKAIILSTHRMNEVEELCDRVFMINKGKGVLYGALSDIKSKYSKNSVFLEFQGELSGLKGVEVRQQRRNSAELILSEGVTSKQVMEQLAEMDIQVTRYEVSTPPLHDIFLQIVGENR
jgi:ABC-2 type transport system ATP-binding protein